MKRIIRITGLSFILLVSGCQFLDETPESVINSANFYTTENDAVAATNALYEYLTVGTEGIFARGFGGIFFNDYWVFKDLLSDNAIETAASQEYRTLSEFRFTAENERIELYWQDLYKTIYAANIVIDRVPQIEMNAMRRDHLVAEAHFIRAMMYFEAVRLFGDVPLILRETVELDEATIPRTDADEVYSAIISDLEWSRDHLSATYRVGLGRPTPMACTALLSKVYLEMGEFELAAQEARIVIESNEYSLFSDYKEIFKIANANSGEIIFAINYSGTLSQGFKPNQYHVRLLPPNLNKNGEGPEQPTDELYNSFDPQDRRKAVTFITSYTYSDGSTVTFEPYIGKFWDQEAEPRANNTDSDVIYLRLADIMLILAEALNEINNGPTQEAYDMINAIRQRARYNGMVEQDILPDLAGLSYQDFKDAILQERQWEFVMEGQRYHDLVRMGKLVETVENSGKLNVNPQSFHVLLPIPQRERGLNSNLTQNPGY